MATLYDKDFSIEFIVENYYFAPQHETHEYYYSCIIRHLNLPIIYGIFRKNRVEKIDFELNDTKLSDMFSYALKNGVEDYLPMTYDGCFDITLTPKLDNWQIKLDIGSLYFERSVEDDFSMTFEMPISKQVLLGFMQDLIKEETAIVQK